MVDVMELREKLAKRLADQRRLGGDLMFYGLPDPLDVALLDALDEAARMQERVERLEAALKTCNEALKELQATVKGECPSLLDEDSGGSANLDMAIEDALEDSDVLLGRCRSCRCPRTWVPTDKCRTPLAHEEQETWADWAKAARTSLSTEMNSEGDK